MSSELIHLSFYRFYRVGNDAILRELRSQLRQTCGKLQLMGTILIASEGINAMMTGSRESIDAFKEYSKGALGLVDQDFKEAVVPVSSFTRMLIKIKREIISVGDDEIRPDEKTARRISPAELKNWLDERREFLLLDTRNHYEVIVGTFKGAQELKLDCSRDFSTKASEHVDEWKNKPVVTFCTGGIRCEKASAALMKLGVEDVYQLDGGILRYFETVGGEHFEGNCFVFDWRLSVKSDLTPEARSPDPEQEYGRHRRVKKSIQL